MKNTFGNAVSLTLFGESHGSEIGCVIDGLAPGMPVSEESIAAFLSRRRPHGDYSTSRVERDPFRIVSGAVNGKATGTPLCILIPNENKISSDYEKIPFRPGHADFAAEAKYHGFQDRRGGGHFSGRITAPLVAAGAILSDALKEKGIYIGTHIKKIASVSDGELSPSLGELEKLSTLPFPVLNEKAGEKMQEEILRAKEAGDSVGGVLETCVMGLPAGLGEPWFDSVESLLSHALFSIPAVKGVEFGAGFEMSAWRGSRANDALRLSSEGKVITETNHNGGINGGITNGMPLIFRVAVKPTPTISIEQKTVAEDPLRETDHAFIGRHDPCIVHRGAVVVDSMTALVVADLLAARFGTDFLSSETAK